MMLGKSIGSGTIIDPVDTILTCAHVVVDFQSVKTVPKGKICDVYSNFVGIVCTGCYYYLGSFDWINNPLMNAIT